MSAFYDSVLDVWDVKESELARVNVGFWWMPEPMVMVKGRADVFEWFLEKVEEAPCREDGLRCTVDVELVLK